MLRRITSIFLAFSILLLSIVLLPGAQVLALTATLRPPTFTPSATAPAGNLPDLTVVSILEYTYSLPTATANATGCWPDGPKSAPGLRVTIKNIGAVAAGSFVLDLSGNRFTVAGLAAGQTLAVDFKISRASRTATVDVTGLIAESNETNNKLTTVNNTTPTRTGTARTICNTPTATPTITPTATGNVSQPDLSFPYTPGWVWDPGSYDSTNGCYNHVPYLVWRVDVRNTGSAPAGSFVVSHNYFSSTQSVPGLAAGQSAILYFSFPGGAGNTAPVGQPTLMPGTANFIADYNNTVSESNENNNRAFNYVPTFTATPYSGATRVFCRVSTSTPTPTPTITLTPSATPTASIGTCGPVNASIAAPFSYDGAGSFCWQSSNLGGYINSWNMTSVTVNGGNYANIWVSTGSLPAKINGYWYIRYTGAYPWSHFEAK